MSSPTVTSSHHRRHRLLRKAGWGAMIVLGLGALLMLAGRFFEPEEIATMIEEADQFEAAHPDAFQEVGGVHAAKLGPEDAPATFFLIHGSPGDWRAFSQYLRDPELTDHYQVVAPDRPGYGQTGLGKTMRSLQDQAEVLIPWAEASPGQRIWVGHSFGVPIIAKLAVLRPDLVDGLVFVAGAMDAELEPKRWFHRIGDTWIARWVLPPDWDVANQEAIAFEHELELMEPEWKEIAAPTTIIHATDDTLASYQHVPFTMERMTKAPVKLVKLESGDHFILWNRYDVIKREMLELVRTGSKDGG